MDEGSPFSADAGEKPIVLRNLAPSIVPQAVRAFKMRRRIELDEKNPAQLQASREAMEQFASVFARERKWRVWLVLLKCIRVWFNEKKQIEPV